MRYVCKELELSAIKLFHILSLNTFEFDVVNKVCTHQDEFSKTIKHQNSGNCIEENSPPGLPPRRQNDNVHLAHQIIPHTLTIRGLHLECIIAIIKVCIVYVSPRRISVRPVFIQ